METCAARRDHILLLASWVNTLAQTTGFTLAEYNAPQYTAPEDAHSSIVIAGTEEPGERLVVTGRTLDGLKPVGGVSRATMAVLSVRPVFTTW